MKQPVCGFDIRKYAQLGVWTFYLIISRVAVLSNILGLQGKVFVAAGLQREFLWEVLEASPMSDTANANQRQGWLNWPQSPFSISLLYLVGM